MSEEIVDEPFRSASEELEATHREGVAKLKAKVEKAKGDALKKVSP